MALPTLLSKRAAADALGVSTRTIDRLRAAGEIQAVRAGSQVRVLEESLAAYLTRQIPPSVEEVRGAKFTPRAIQRRRLERQAKDAA